MKENKFSITIPAYKSHFLEEAIKSCLSQTYKNFELVIVDDYSPEDLKSIVAPFLSDERVRYYRNEKNFGAVDVVDNWNKALSYCTGQYVICMGDDDRLMPCCLAEYAKLIDKYPGTKVFHAWSQIIDENGNVTSLLESRPEWESAISFLWRRWGRGCQQFIGDFCFDIEDLRRQNGFFKQPLAWASDDISSFRAAMVNGIANTQTFCFQYRVNSLTISNTGNMEIKLKAKKMEKEWYDSALSKYMFQHETDEIVLKFVKKQMPRYFYREIDNLMYHGMRQNISDFLFLIKNHIALDISVKQIVKSFLKSIKSRIL